MRYGAKSVVLQNLKNQSHVYVAQKYENLHMKTLCVCVCISIMKLSG